MMMNFYFSISIITKNWEVELGGKKLFGDALECSSYKGPPPADSPTNNDGHLSHC